MKSTRSIPSSFSLPDLGKLVKLARTVDVTGLELYLIAYSVFINYFSSIDKITANELIIGAHLVYGWMPTILTLGKNDLVCSCEALNRVKAGELLQLEDLIRLQEIVNNSVVGLSKLLHFIRPDRYPIWDSNVASFVSQGPYPQHKINDARYYMHFITYCQQIINAPGYEPIHQLLMNQLGGSPMSRLRSLDIIMFTEGSRLTKATYNR